MGFANGASSVNIGNGPALASEIGGATLASGSRLVNPAGVVGSHAFGVAFGSFDIDTSGGVSIAIAFALENINVTPGTVTFILTWYDPLKTDAIYQESLELNCGIGGSTTTTLLMDRILGPLLNVNFFATTGIVGNLGLNQVQYLVQNVPVDTRRLVESNGVNLPGDGLLGTFTDTLGSGAAGGQHAFQLTNGLIQVRTSVGSAATAAGQFLFSWGAGLLQPFVVLCQPGLDNIFQVPATNRPLGCKITNKGTVSTSFNVAAWTNSD